MTIENVMNCEEFKRIIKICLCLSFTQRLTTVQLDVMSTHIR